MDVKTGASPALTAQADVKTNLLALARLSKLQARLRKCVEQEEAVSAQIGRLMSRRADLHDQAAGILADIRMLAEANQ